MAKKVRKRPEDDDLPTFEFPDFDTPGFLWKEFEMTNSTAVAGLFALGLGLVGWVLTGVGLPWFVPLILGLVGIVGSAFVLERVRPTALVYTKGDWAGLFALEFFGWLAIWFVLLNIVSSI